MIKIKKQAHRQEKHKDATKEKGELNSEAIFLLLF